MVAIKEATGQNLDWFFEQWFYKPGHPVFDVSYLWDKNVGKVNLKIIQTQDTAEGIPIFKTAVVIGIITPSGKKSEKVWLEEKGEEFEFECTQKPLMVRFDEGNYLLKEWTFEKDVDELIYQLAHDDVTGRMWAASELKNFKNDSLVITKLKECAESDSFWAVRRDALYTLGSFKKEELTSFFKKKARGKNSKVRVAALTALGDLKKGYLTQFFQQRFKKDNSYLVQAEALRSIGKSGNNSFVPFLVEASRMKSPRNVIKRAADWALEEIREAHNFHRED